MCKNIKNRLEFKRQIEILWDEDYWGRELEEFPTMVFGGFEQSRLRDLFRVVNLHPEYHIATCIEPDLWVNRYVPGGQMFYLAEGDSDPQLVHDPFDRLDAHFFYSLNSARTKRSA